MGLRKVAFYVNLINFLSTFLSTMLEYQKVMAISFLNYIWLKKSLPLAFYIFWLISFPLEGPLLLANGIYKIIYFTLPHIVAFFVSARLIKERFWNKISFFCTIVVILATLLFPILPIYKYILLTFIGFFSAPVVLRALSILSTSSKLLLSVGVALALGNILVALLSFLPLYITLKFLIISFALLPIIFHPPGHIKETDLKDLKFRLPFIYFFYLIGGLLYGFIMKEYKKSAVLNSLELAFYVTFALLGIYIINKNKEFTLAFGIFLSMLAFSFFKVETIEDIYIINISMFLLQASFAIIDFYLICILIENGFNIKRVSYGLGVMCLALLSGEIISANASNAASYLIVFGNIALTLSVFIFYFLWERYYKQPENYEKSKNFPTTKIDKDSSGVQNNQSDIIDEIISSCPIKFSPQEEKVLRHLMLGETYKTIAMSLQISESSVKTYVRRICEKLGVQRKDGIVKALKEYKK